MALIGLPNTKKIIIFVVLYILGNVLALTATGFLLGKKTDSTGIYDSIGIYYFIGIYDKRFDCIFMIFDEAFFCGYLLRSEIL